MRLLKREFREWLEAQNPKAIAGYPDNRTKCPLHKWLTSKGKKDVVVGLNNFSIEDNTYKYKMPVWGTKFQEVAISYVLDNTKSEKLTFGTALKIMNEV